MPGSFAGRAGIGTTDAPAGSEERLFTIAGTYRIRSGKDENGLYLADTKSDLVARPGDAIDAEIILRSSAGGARDLLAAGWPVWSGCGSGLAIVHSVVRVHR